MLERLPTPDEYDAALARHETLVVKFTAAWCAPCQKIAPQIDELAQLAKEKAHFAEIDVDENDEVTERLGISSMPTFHVYSKGQLVHEIRGGNVAAIRDAVDAAQAPAPKTTADAKENAAPVAAAVLGFGGDDEDF